jgi:hypothetical protein
VFEHVHDPLGTLRIIREIIKPDGHLFMVVPNYRGLERMLFRTRWFALELPRHLYHFTPDAIRRMLTQGGFQVEKLEHASGHDTFRFSLRLLARRPMPDAPTTLGADSRGGGSGSGRQRSLARAAHSFNGAVVGGFTTLADRLALGSQLLVVARPS